MSFRTKLLFMFTATVVIVVAVVGAVVSLTVRRAFDRADADRRTAVETKFSDEFARRGEDVAAAVERIVARDQTLRLAAESGRPNPDYASYVNEGEALARWAAESLRLHVRASGKAAA